jgi:hypothetical protein
MEGAAQFDLKMKGVPQSTRLRHTPAASRIEEVSFMDQDTIPPKSASALPTNSSPNGHDWLAHASRHLAKPTVAPNAPIDDRVARSANREKTSQGGDFFPHGSQ